MFGSFATWVEALGHLRLVAGYLWLLWVSPSVLFSPLCHSKHLVWVLHVLGWVSSLQLLFLYELVGKSVVELVTGQLIKLHM